MGDLIMTGPALRALRESFGCKITVLTSSMAAGIAKLMPEVDDVMIFDVPWVKSNFEADIESFDAIVRAIRKKQFDAAVIFTVYSQNPLPTVMLAYFAGIPKRLAYCRENPYQLLTDWVPDREPYSLIKHQVRRDLDLVAAIGAATANDQLQLKVNDGHTERITQILTGQGIDIRRPWLIFHPGVSEAKRAYPAAQWVAAATELMQKGWQIVLTGASSEKQLCEIIHQQIGKQSVNAAGLFNLEEFVALINRSPVVVSVNTGTVHIAAAVNTPVVVLYALTNPQHTPWKVPCKVLPFPVPVAAQSKNEVIRHVNTFLYSDDIDMPDGKAVACAVQELLHPTPAGANAELLINGLPHHKPC